MSKQIYLAIKLILILLILVVGFQMIENQPMNAESSEDSDAQSKIALTKEPSVLEEAQDIDWKSKGEDYWKEKMTPEQFQVSRKAVTEMPFSGKYYKDKRKGDYRCSSCGQVLFSSDTKYDSGSGWPSFTDPVNTQNVRLITDNSHGMQRTEVVCARCGAHLGHVFNDGPSESGNRFCINSLSLVHELDQK